MTRIGKMWQTLKDSSLSVKGLVVVVLVYIFFPFDFVSDFIPVVGLGDDFLALLVTLVGLYEKSKKADLAAPKTTEKDEK